MTSYSLEAYCQMVSRGTRASAYVEAMRAAITPDSVVLDLGAGTGIMALTAARLGAKRVYAIETNRAVHLASELAEQNGLADRIVVVRGRSEEIELDEPVDVIVSDLRGSLPLFERHIQTIVDARTRFLARGGVLIPRRDHLFVSAVSCQNAWRESIERPGEDRFGLDLSEIRVMLTNRLHNFREEPVTLGSDPVRFATLDYATVESPDVEGEVDLVLREDAVVHGFALWFEAELFDRIGFDAAPGSAAREVYGLPFLPLSEPLALERATKIHLVLSFKWTGAEYVITWETAIEKPSGRGSLSFRQSTFLGDPIPPDILRTRAPEYVPRLGEEGEVHRLALERMGRRESVGKIVEELTTRFPRRFPTGKDALTFVADLVERFGRE